ncbi:MAG TPA: DNA recombination protein RmuC [Polyangia bacterium]|jgi:DNA recombination protein RmuC
MDGIAVLAGILAGIALGGAFGWLVGAARTRAEGERMLRDMEGRARASSATADELRRTADASRGRADGFELELRRMEGERAAIAARAGELERGLAEQRRLLDDAKGELGTTFQALAAEALQRSNEGFLQLATEKLAAARREGATDLAAREQAIAALVTPLRQSLDKIDQQAQALERSRGEAYVDLKAQVGFLMQGQDRLRAETGNLVNALRAPAVRGRWGEIQLRRVLEIAGMVEHCDFGEQQTLDTAEGRLRPDVVVHLPGGKSIVVDAKAPLAAYLSALEAKSDAEQQQHLLQHAGQVRTHFQKLGAKNYWDQFASSPELVVMFLPGDRFYAAALEQMPGLIEEAFANRVLIATPTTLIGILQAIHAGWKQERLAANAEEISRAGRDLHERLATFAEHLTRVGSALGRTVEAFNGTVGSFDTRVLPGARRLEEMGAGGKKALPDLVPIDARPRALAAEHDLGPPDA